VAVRQAARERLSRDRVIAAATAVADAEGVEAVTMRRLAEALQVHPTSLYNHVPTKDAILDGIAEALLAEAHLPDHFDGWQDWVRALATGLRDVARAHPGAFLVLTQRAATGPTAADATEAALDAFARAGLSPGRASEAVAGVSLALLGVALNECPPTATFQVPEPWPERYPRTAEALAADDVSQDNVWQLVVDSLIAGVIASGASA
jgi:AcrR family transcriptional regulator